MHPIIHYITKELEKASDFKTANKMQAYMKTEQPFYGVTAVPRRAIFKSAISQFNIDSHAHH